MDTLKMFCGSIQHQRQVKGLEKAERILELIKMAAIRKQVYLHDSQLNTVEELYT
jgi:hypothetical protein